jgi:FlaG/FlaF family flagellin (archaellin)/DNA-directed RNA polymerase subunit RPC12/RpoP
MAKEIKAIKCPHCGSVYKQEIRPGFYKCQSCGTEYFLDSDDVHIYHHHERPAPLQSSAPPGNQKLPVYLLIGVLASIAIVYLLSGLINSKTGGRYVNTNSTYKTPRMFSGSFVYMNTTTGDPVYLRLGTDQIDQGNDKFKRELHAQFNNAITDKLIADRIINDQNLFDNDCSVTFKAYSPKLIYGIACSNILFQLDTRSNQLSEVTQSTFKDFPELSSGVAKVEFDYSKAMIKVMSNEGNSYYYFPLARILVDNEAQMEAVWKQLKDRHHFEFGSIADDFRRGETHQLIEINYTTVTAWKTKRDLTPERKYFNPKILYQDDEHLLIVTNTTAGDEPPVSVQCIDVSTGKIQWALPPNKYDLYSVAKCKQGYAIEYRKGAEADYVHGVFIVSPSGKQLHDYQLGRTE